MPPSCTDPPIDPLTERQRWHAEQEASFAVVTLIAAERGAVIPIIRDALDELLYQEREHHKSELVERARGLEVQVAKLEAAVSALELASNIERTKVFELPKFPLKNVN